MRNGFATTGGNQNTPTARYVEKKSSSRLRAGQRNSAPAPAGTNFGMTGGGQKRKSMAGVLCVRIAVRFSTRLTRERSRSASVARTAILNSVMGEGSDCFWKD